MEVFLFGPTVDVDSKRGGIEPTSRFHLNLQCDWAIMRSGRVEVGFEDHFYEQPDADNDRNSARVTLADEPTLRDLLLYNYFFEDRPGPRIVTGAELRGYRDVDISLDDGSVLEVRALHHLEGDMEYWRLTDFGDEWQLVAEREVRVGRLRR
jgi:hypothetical protein